MGSPLVCVCALCRAVCRRPTKPIALLVIHGPAKLISPSRNNTWEMGLGRRVGRAGGIIFFGCGISSNTWRAEAKEAGLQRSQSARHIKKLLDQLGDDPNSDFCLIPNGSTSKGRKSFNVCLREKVKRNIKCS